MQGAMLHLYAKNEREHNATSLCYYCEQKTQGEHIAPHLLFVVGFAIKKHAHIQIIRTTTK
jgi:hypothetical protein